MHSDIFWSSVLIIFLALAILKVNWIRKSLFFNLLVLSIIGIIFPSQTWFNATIEGYKFNSIVFSILITVIALWLDITLCIKWIVRSR